MKLTEINIYPLKSGAVTRVRSCAVEPRGLKGDRRWMVTDENGQFLTARRFPKLVLIQPVAKNGNSIELGAPGAPPLRIEATDVEPRKVTVWRSHTTAADAGNAAARWISDYLGCSARIVFQREEDHRSVETPRTSSDNIVSFADAYPLLIVGTASLEALNDRLADDVDMDRFRPNAVVETEIPFAEDNWKTVRIGNCVFDAVKRCSRCVLITVDPQTGIKHPEGEPLTTLHSMRFDPDTKGILFGMNLIPRSGATIQVGDQVSVEN